MFDSKVKSLFEAPKKAKAVTTSAFVNAAMKTAAKTFSGNGSEKFSTTPQWMAKGHQ